MELSAEEADKLATQGSDRARKVRRVGRTFLVPHKFSPTGEVLDEETFKPARDLSQLSLPDFALLASLQETGWDIVKSAKALDMDPEAAKRRFKRLQYFEFEAKRSQALAQIASPDFITAKHVDNVYSNTLDDGQRDSLRELAKITGAYKQAVLAQTNIFNMPSLTPEQEAALREIGDSIAMKKNAIPAEVAHA